MEKVRGLQNLAYQLGWEEGKESPSQLMEKVRGFRTSPTSSSWRKVREPSQFHQRWRLTEPSYQLGWEEGKRVHHCETLLTFLPGEGARLNRTLPTSSAGRKVRLSPSQLMEKVRGLQNLAYQLGWEEGKRVHHS